MLITQTAAGKVLWLHQPIIPPVGAIAPHGRSLQPVAANSKVFAVGTPRRRRMVDQTGARTRGRHAAPILELVISGNPDTGGCS